MRTWMKDKRQEAGLTMDEMAAKLNISTPYYSLIEAGKRQQRMDITLVTKLAEIFSLTLEDVVELEEARA